MPISDIAQILDLGLTGALAVAVVALWLDGKATRAELIKVLKEIAGLKAQGVEMVRNKCFVVWVDEEGHRAAIAKSIDDYRQWLAENPLCAQYHIVDNAYLYHLATTDEQLRGLDYEQVLELIMYIEVPF